MASTFGLIFYAILSFIIFASHSLSGLLPNLINTADVTILFIDYDCTWASGVFISDIIEGDCPLGYTSEGKSTYDAICGKDDENKGEKNCEQAKAEMGGIALAVFFYAIITTISLFMMCMGGGKASRRGFYLVGVFALFATFLSLMSLSVFEERSKDEDSGWADSYGCSDGQIPWLGNATGESCFLRGPGYYFHTIAIFLSFVHCVCLFCSGCGIKEQQIPVYVAKTEYVSMS